MLKIRLKRLGRKKKAFYKLVLMPNLAKRDGKSIEDLGYYDPFKKLLHLKKHIFNDLYGHTYKMYQIKNIYND